MPLPKNYLGIDFSKGARLPLPLDLSIIPVATLLGVVWVVVDHNNHSWLELVPLVHSAGPRTNILGQQLNLPILWVAATVNVTAYQFAAQRQTPHHHRCFLPSAASKSSWMYKSMFEWWGTATLLRWMFPQALTNLKTHQHKGAFQGTQSFNFIYEKLYYNSPSLLVASWPFQWQHLV